MEIFPAQKSIVTLVKTGESAVETFNLVGCETSFLLNSCNLFLPQQQ